MIGNRETDININTMPSNGRSGRDTAAPAATPGVAEAAVSRVVVGRVIMAHEVVRAEGEIGSW
jgi:hypothetical protein